MDQNKIIVLSQYLNLSIIIDEFKNNNFYNEENPSFYTKEQ